MMDGSLHLVGQTNDQRMVTFRQWVSRIKRNEGCLVLDWHSDSLQKGFMDDMSQALLGELETISTDDTCWMTSLADVVSWCREGRWQSR